MKNPIKLLDCRIEDLKLIKFFSYTSTIHYNNRYFDYDFKREDGKSEEIGEKFIKLHRNLVQKAVGLPGVTMHESFFNDNKTVFLVENTFSGERFFIGLYDNEFSLGYSCFLYQGYVYDFEKMKMSEYLEDVKCDGNKLWKSFEI